MVKRDRSLMVMRGVTKLLAILLFLVPLIFFWGYVFGGWPIGAGDIIPIAMLVYIQQRTNLPLRDLR